MATDSSAYHPHYLHNEHALAAMLELGQAELKELAAEGEPYALLALGSKYLNGSEGLERSQSKGFECYLKAAEKGLPFAQILAGQHYRDGDGVEVNKDEAKKWFQKAAVQNAPPAMHELALYHMDEGRLDDAVELLHEAAELGFSSSQFQLGNLYEFDKTIGKNYPEAFKWISRAAADNDDAKFHLAHMLRNGIGCETDPVAALIILEELAEQGHLEGTFVCGTMHWLGDGTVRDVERGAKYIEWAAQQNLLEAASWLTERKHERKPTDDYREKHDIDDWLNMAAPSETALHAILPFESYVDETVLSGRAKILNEFGVLAMDSRLVHYHCESCDRTFNSSVIKHLPKVPYGDWPELINWLHMMAHVDFDDLTSICPDCGQLADIAAVDLHVHYSDLKKDLVFRTLYPEEDNIPLAYRVFLWDIENGYQIEVTHELDEETLAVDALARRFALLLDTGGEQAVKSEVLSYAESREQITTLLNVGVLHGCKKPYPWLGEYICEICMDKYPLSSEPYTAMAAYLLNKAHGEVDEELAERIEKLLVTAINLDPDNETAKTFLNDLRNATE
ncbi:MAG TPA: tetratricopeptide repeat protein [Drouetiella sp.]